MPRRNQRYDLMSTVGLREKVSGGKARTAEQGCDQLETFLANVEASLCYRQIIHLYPTMGKVAPVNPVRDCVF